MSDERRTGQGPEGRGGRGGDPGAPAGGGSGWGAVLLGFRWPMTALVVAFLAHVALTRWCADEARRPGAAAEAVDRAAAGASAIAERFRSGTITTTFTASIPRLVPGGASLEVAVLEGTETFARTDERRVLFDLVHLGTNETEIRVPATYRYHVRLDDEWRVDVRDHACIVRAPAIRPSLPPAIHTDRMEKRSVRGWARFDVDQQMEELHRSITPTLDERASAPESIDLVREPARARVADLVQRWLLLEDHWREDRFRSVTVFFPDEPPPGEALPDPTIVLMRSD